MTLSINRTKKLLHKGSLMGGELKVITAKLMRVIFTDLRH